MAPAAIAPEGAVQPGGSNCVVGATVLDGDAATPREVPPTAAVAIPINGATGDAGLGDGTEPAVEGE
jgi:hypothetical protein